MVGRSQREHSDSEWKPSQRDICFKCGSSNSCEKLATVLSASKFLVGLPRYTEARVGRSSKLVRYSRIHTLDSYSIPSTTTSRQTRPNGWISIHAVGNPSSVDGIPTTGWKSIQWMDIPPGVGWISNHLSQNGWMEIQPSMSQSQA